MADKLSSRPPLKIGDPKVVRKMFRSYGTDIGHLAIAWNTLHETLSQLFEVVLRSRSPKIGAAIWYSTDSDFSQRKMLRSATEHARHLTARQRSDILGMLDKIDNTLRHQRNNAMHAPLVLILSSPESWIEADPDSESPRAKALRGKDIRKEFRLCRDLAGVLSKYAHEMHRALTWPARYSWPEKPPLPHANQKKSRRGSSRQSIRKQP